MIFGLADTDASQHVKELLGGSNSLTKHPQKNSQKFLILLKDLHDQPRRE